MNAKVEQLIDQMTLEEKISLCSGGSDWSTQPIERLGIPEIFMTDGPHGVRWMDLEVKKKATDDYGMMVWIDMGPEKGLVEKLYKATCFPTSATTASSWDRELLKEIGLALGEECQHFGIGVLLGPGTNIKRHPLTGRNFEYFSEDPCLAGELVAAYIDGVQSQGVGTSIKHFACNNAEFERLSMSSEVDERALREIYLAVFERAISKAQPWTVMSAYNRVNGVDASHNKYLLTEILKKEWGFEGVVVSDWWSVNDRVRAAQAGLDLEMPPDAAAEDRLLKATKSGDVPETQIDDMVRRVLHLVFKADAGRREGLKVDFDAHHALARRAAADSIVLLKNDADLLPLNVGARQKIAVIGRMAIEPRYQGVGSSLVSPTRLANALDAIQAEVGMDDRVEYAHGYQRDGKINPMLLGEACNAAINADVAILFVGLPIELEVESWDREHMNLPAGHIQMIQAISAAQKNTIVVLSNGSCVAMKPWIDDVPAVLEAWLGGQAGGQGIVDVLFGRVNPSGKLAVTIPQKLEDTPAFLHFPGENGLHLYGEGIFVGYRYYDMRKIEPLFAFGFGLSYTHFAYSNLLIDKDIFSDQEQITVNCTITNTGDRQGKDVVQLYIVDHEARLSRPEKELKGFVKVSLEADESQTVSFTLNSRDFSYFDPALSRWVAESGAFDILIGKSSRDICLRQTVTLRSAQSNFVPLTKDSYVKDFLNDPEARKIFIDFLIDHELISPELPDNVIDGLRNIFAPIARSLDMFTKGALTEGELNDLLAKINTAKRN